MTDHCSAPNWSLSHFIVPREKSTTRLRCCLLSKFFDHSFVFMW